MNDKVEVKLSKSIEMGNGTRLEKLELRAPNFGDLMKHGLPISQDGQIHFDKAAPLLEALTGIQLPYLKTLSVKDTMSAIKAMVDVFGLTEEEAKN